ncbi:MAG: polysaccharide biosynthesis protein, partial [Nitrosopumilaceae archaeon]
HRVMKYHFNDDRLEFCLGDLRDYETLSQHLKNIDTVFHAGALKQIPYVEFHPMEAIKTNTLSAFNVMKACDERGVKKVIAISTDKACQPVNSYGMSKALMEKIFIGDDVESETVFSCVRYGNVLGSRGSVLPVWDKMIHEGKPIPVTSFKMRRFFLTLDQAVGLILFTHKTMKGNEIFVAKAPVIKISDLASVYAYTQTGDRNYPLNEIGIRAGEKLDEMLISQEEMYYTEDLGDYFRINRPENYSTTTFSPEEYSSQTAPMLNFDEIHNTIKDLEWRK